jgi:hypothetical protein
MSQKIRYTVGRHELELATDKSRWTVTVDGVAVERWFTSLADAWTAGVNEAGHLDLGDTDSLPIQARS